MNQLARAKEDLAARKDDAEEARAVAEKTQAQIEATKADLVAGDNKQRELLSQVKGDIADLVAKQEAERRAADEAAARAKASAAPVSTSGGSGAALSSSSGSGSMPDAGTATEWWSRDCSCLRHTRSSASRTATQVSGRTATTAPGLTMMAWGQAGVGMPHGSTEQYNMFPHVSLSQAQPGDLIVWDGHVGIYIGGGMMIHAPHTGTVVQIAPIYGTPWGRPG